VGLRWDCGGMVVSGWWVAVGGGGWATFFVCKKKSESIWGHFIQIIRRGLGVRGSHCFPKVPKMSPNGFGFVFYIQKKSPKGLPPRWVDREVIKIIYILLWEKLIYIYTRYARRVCCFLFLCDVKIF